MVYAHVIYKKTGLERKNVTVKAYNLIKNQYTLLGYVDENGNPVEGPQEQRTTTTQKKSAAPAVSRQKMSPEEIEAKKAELRTLNEVAIQKVKDEQAKEKGLANAKIDPTQEVVLIEHSTLTERRKPGPKPKNHA